MAVTKTNAMRLLDAAKIAYRTAAYAYDESDLSGLHAAEAIGMPAEQVFKTLVTRADRTGITVFWNILWMMWKSSPAMWFTP